MSSRVKEAESEESMHCMIPFFLKCRKRCISVLLELEGCLFVFASQLFVAEIQCTRHLSLEDERLIGSQFAGFQLVIS